MMHINYFIPLVIIGILAMVGWLMKSTLRCGWFVITLTALACSLADWIILAALPWLGLSFGPVGLPLFLITIVRLSLITPALAFLVIRKLPAQRPKILIVVAIMLQMGLLGMEVYGMYYEPFRLRVTELPVPAPSFLPNRPLRVLQISDLHVERITRRERDVLVRVEEIQPDLIVLTGDYVNMDYLKDPLAVKAARQVLLQLEAPYGIYAVNGTTDTPFVMTIFDKLDVRLLGDWVEIVSMPGGDLYLVGVTDSGDSARDRQALETLMTEIPHDAYTLLLYHTPDLIKTASALGIDLYLAGHTHGGQIRLPFYGALVTFSEYGKQYEMGKYLAGPTILYVTRGLGMEGWSMPRVRFLCQPELVLLEMGR